jgi:hypothetical protein
MAIERSTAIGAFTDNLQAERGIEELRKAGFTDQQVGYITRNGGTEEMPAGETSNAAIVRTTAGIVGGGVIGGMTVAAVALLLPGVGSVITGGMLAVALGAALIGAVTGGFVSTLIDMGIPEDEALYYQQELAKGRTLVTVKTGGRYQDAVVVLRQSGAYDASSRNLISDADVTEAIPAAPIPASLPPVSIDADHHR